MRVSKQVQKATRKTILQASHRLFRRQGFAETTTRAIAAEAGIATGTLFNYFPTKEAVLVELAVDELLAAQRTFKVDQADGDRLDEDLFAFVASGLRRLRVFRKFLHPALATLTNPLTDDTMAATVRQQHLDIVVALSRKHLVSDIDSVGLQLYWTLYAGVLTFWSKDKSPRQEDTWALLDQSMQMFVHWLNFADE